jgi:hypothetical protein
MTTKLGVPASKGCRAGLLGVSGLALLALASAGTVGCLDRPVSPTGPNVTNVTVDRISQNQVDKIDLLFMIDNSLSMADKQAFLREAMPGLLRRLVEPDCVDGNGNTRDRAAGLCPAGTQPEFTPITDIHIGVVTSSLGARGMPCNPGGQPTPVENDNGHLVGSTRGAMQTYAGLGFLAWDSSLVGNAAKPDGFPGESINNVTALNQAFTTMIQNVGEQGCGYESSLEGWYRFLVDPEPPADIVWDGAVSVAQGVDSAVLTQRAAFLRPDSLVAIIMLTDENDCSIIDYGQGWLVANAGRLPRAVSRCAQNPNDRCCISCQQRDVPSGCPSPAQDPECTMNAEEGYGPGALASWEDTFNLRCWQTKRRFGFDLLFPTSRYVDGLTQSEVCSRRTDAAGKCVPVPNPLMSASPEQYPELSYRTDSSLIYLAGIVGVPWQDIATPETLKVEGQLELMDYSTLTQSGRWEMMLGDPNASPPTPPRDPFMIESVDPRSGANPVSGDPIVPPGNSDPRGTINGHETDASEKAYRDDLQYACIFQLPQTMQRNCDEPEYTTTDLTIKKGCDCQARFVPRNRALCQPPGGGETVMNQYFAKGYPGLRLLQVLKDFGEQSMSQSSIVASVCPKVAEGSPTEAAYGYNPAVTAIINRLKEKLKGACLGRRIVTNDVGEIECQVVEVTQWDKVPEAMGCSSPGRQPLPAGLEAPILKNLRDANYCSDKAPKPRCVFGPGGVNLCKLTQAGPPESFEYQSCLNDTVPNGVTGYCYIDALQDANGNGTIGCLQPDGSLGGPESAPASEGGDCIGNVELVKDCSPTLKRLLRFVSPEDGRVPAKNSTVILACKGASM